MPRLKKKSKNQILREDRNRKIGNVCGSQDIPTSTSGSQDIPTSTSGYQEFDSLSDNGGTKVS
jgi:hypothetical protein